MAINDDPAMEAENLLIVLPARCGATASDRPMKFLGTDDMRQMLRLALRLYRLGDPRTTLDKAMQRLAWLTDATAWTAAVIPPKSRGIARNVIAVRGDSKLKVRDVNDRAFTILAGRHMRSRVFARISGPHAILSRLRPDAESPAGSVQTSISIFRNENAIAFVERERRLVELFHSQTAWLLSSLAPLPGLASHAYRQAQSIAAITSR
jgi:hypothetical protein